MNSIFNDNFTNPNIYSLRGVLTGFAVSLSCCFGFISRKTHYNLETTLSLPGISLFYGITAGFAFVSMYFILPETEGRTLEDIEHHFSDNSKRITDWKIEKTNTECQNQQKTG